jgi:hypothetical protein
LSIHLKVEPGGARSVGIKLNPRYNTLKILSGKQYCGSESVGSSVADPDPGSDAFLTPGSGIRNRFFRIPDLGSQTHIFES